MLEIGPYFFFDLTLAHRALAAADIFALAAALMVRLFLTLAFPAKLPLAMPALPNRRFSSFCRLSILSFIAAAFRNCFAVRSIIICVRLIVHAQ